MHLDEERLQRLLHGELAPPAAASARDHLATCAECRGRAAEAEREEAWAFDLLRGLDHPPPRVHVATIVTAARGRGGFGWRRWAAGIVLALGGAAAAYAAPGSPLPGLVDRVITWIDRAPRRPEQAAPSGGPGDVAQGIAVAPGDRFTIAFSAHQAGGLATVSLTDGAEVEVRAIGGAATFSADVDRLSIDNGGSAARFEIQVPRRAPRVEILVGGRRVFSKDASGVRTEGRRDAEGRYLLPLARPVP